MDVKWVNERNAELAQKIAKKRQEIIDKINAAEFLTEEDKVYCIGLLDGDKGRYLNPFEYISLDTNLTFTEAYKNIEGTTEGYMTLRNWANSLDTCTYFFMIEGLQTNRNSRYLDSKPQEFEGDIIITDPCYVLVHDEKHHRDDWERCEYGKEMENLGFKNYMTRDTIYGDWSCTTFDSVSGEPIGHFCADAGLVSVFLLEDILRYNPEYNDYLEKKWTATWIPNFKGAVQFIVEHTEGTFEEDTEWCKAGEKLEDFEVRVAGHGINTKTGEEIHFITSQTGL